MIQYINYDGKLDFELENMTVNSIENVKSLDMFDLNIIDLSNGNFWKTYIPYEFSTRVGCLNDFSNVKEMVAARKNANILYLLPRDCYYKFKYNPVYKNFEKKVRLRDIISDFCDILQSITPTFLSLRFEMTDTKLISEIVPADFYFTIEEDSYKEIATKSVKSNKATTIHYVKSRIYLSTVKINNKAELLEFLQVLNLISPEKEQEPKWMGGFNMFDDAKQQEVIQMTETEIAELKEKIKKAEEALQENKKYKSVLYTQGDELVNVVFEMLEEMLEVDLSEFEDKKKEDVSFKIGDRIFIGEIKGISDNVKAKNLSQLYNHYYNFEERHPEIDGSDVYKLLIINHQRKKPLDQRDPVDINQINLAENNMGILIVETSELLKLFEKFRNKKITRDEIIQKLTRFGILKIDEN